MYSTNRGPSKLDIMNTENLPTTSGLTVKGHSQSENLFARLHSQAVNLPTRGSQSNNADTRGQCYSDHVTSKGMDVGEALSWLKREVVSLKLQNILDLLENELCCRMSIPATRYTILICTVYRFPRRYLTCYMTIFTTPVPCVQF